MCTVALSLAGSNALAQELSREQSLKEAGRLGTEAEQIQAAAMKQTQATGDRKFWIDATRAAAEKFLQALELWRAAGDLNRLFTGTEEVSRLYFILNDYDAMVNCLKRESDYWLARGDVSRQIHLIALIGTRQMQMRRADEAIKTLERAIEMSHAADLTSVEIQALEMLTILFEKQGRLEDVESIKARTRELYTHLYNSPSDDPKQDFPVATIPAQWLDLPAAPLVADYRSVENGRQAILINRSTKGIEYVAFGCIRSQNNKAVVIRELAGVSQNHGGVGPGFYYEPFGLLSGPANRWTDEKMGCEDKARIAVIKVVYDDRTEWSAEGMAWKSRR